MGSFLETRVAPAQANPFLETLVADVVFRSNVVIRYALQGAPGTTGVVNDGGALWRANGAYAGFTESAAAWAAVSNLRIQPYGAYYNGSNGSFGPGGITWVEQLAPLGANSTLLGEHGLPVNTEQYGTFNNQHPFFTTASNARGGRGFTTFLHEIGHGLGLEHPHEGNRFAGVSSAYDTGDFGLNQSLFTIMSYNDGYDVIGQSPSLAYGWQATPGAFDIAAMQSLYGANMATASGDTVYRLPGVNAPGTFFACIWDAGGIDTIRGEGAGGVTIDLRPASLQNEAGGGGWLSRVSGIYGGFTIANAVIIENAIGGSGDDILTGNDAANQLIGGGGADALYGGSGNDSLDGGDGFNVLDGGTGADLMIGGNGSNIYAVDNSNDIIVEAASPPDNDSVRATASFYLPANIENLYLDGTAYFGVGNGIDNVIDANNADNLLLGGGGHDRIRAFDGNNLVFGEEGNDEIDAGSGIDYLVGGTGNDRLVGRGGADALYGEDGNDSLYGGGDFVTDILVGGEGDDLLDGGSEGDYDLMDGGGGNDQYFVDTPADLTFEAVGGGVDTVSARISGAGYYLYANTENLVLEGSTPFGVGNELDNMLTGNDSGNYLLGGAGNDTLDGRRGNDVLFGEGGSDRFVFGRGTGGDVIGDFQAGVDRIVLTGLGFGSFVQLRTAFVENGGTTAINLGQGDFIVLNGVSNAALTAIDFILG